MRRVGRHRPHPATSPDLNSALPRYRAHRACVDAAHERMRAVDGRPHSPAEGRRAAGELTLALRRATAFITEVLLVAGPAEWWSRELVRLSQIAVWLRRATLDDLGVELPAAVRVGSRAASGPHVAGLEADPPALVVATLHEPWIGVPLREIVDGEISRSSGAAHRP